MASTGRRSRAPANRDWSRGSESVRHLPWIGIVALVTGMATVSGCSRTEARVDRMEIYRNGWDTLEVAIRFVEPRFLAADRELRPDSLVLVLFSADYDTLYAGGAIRLPVVDRLLGDEEPLLLEACGRFGGSVVCDQRSILASPKRVVARPVVTWPDSLAEAVAGGAVDPAWARGRWSIDPRVERQRFGTVEWEEIGSAILPPLHLRVHVIGGESDGMDLPLPGTEGGFDLSSNPEWAAFRYDLRSAFRDSAEAYVRFDVTAHYATGRSAAGGRTLRVRALPEEQELRELSSLVEEASRTVGARLFDERGPGRLLVFVNDWSYEPSSGRYLAEVEIHRREGVFGRWQAAEGRLAVGVDGTRPVFTLAWAGDDIVDRWREAAPSDSLVLQDLPDPRRPPRPTVRR